MSQGLDLHHGGFRAPRVPFDLRCVILAALGYLAVRGLDLLLEWWLGVPSPVAQLVALIGDQLDQVAFVGAAFRRAMDSIWGHEPYALEWDQAVLTGVGFVAVWSFFGAAVLRAAALKLTRDDPLPLKDALKFGGINFLGFVKAPLLVLGFVGFFALCNVAAGAIIAIPLLGSSILVLILFPLVLIASLLIILAIIGGVVGLPLMWAGIAVEQNGPLEALSRAYSYIFARPFRFFFSYFLLFVVMSVLLVAAGHFETTLKGTLKAGVWRKSLDESVSKPPRKVDVLEPEYQNADRPRLEEEGIANIKNIRDASGWDWVGFFWMWLLLSIFMLGFKGYALYFFLGGTASLYLQLRREVDGTGEEEIYPETEEEMAAEGSEPRWVAEGGQSTEAQPES